MGLPRRFINNARSFSAFALALPAYAICGPAEYPMLDWDKARVHVIVANLAPGGNLALPAKASEPGSVTIVLNPAVWFRADVQSMVYGDALASSFEVATLSHWGLDPIKASTHPALIAVAADGDRYVMPNRAMAKLGNGPRGALFVPVLSNSELHWLPCAVFDMKEEIGEEYMSTFTYLANHNHFDYAKSHPELYRISAAGAVPRYGVFIDKIARVLRTAYSGQRDR